jgi:hypothetical protein
MGKTFKKFHSDAVDEGNIHQKRASHKGHAKHPQAVDEAEVLANIYVDPEESYVDYNDPAIQKVLRELKRQS